MKCKLSIILIILLHAIPYISSAQDIILRKNGDEISAKITEITLDEVKYKKFSNPSGPVYTEHLSGLFMIKYENGDKDLFEKDAVTGKINIRHTASPQPAQTPANTGTNKGTNTGTNKGTAAQKTTSPETPETTVKADNTKGLQQTKATSPKGNTTPPNNQPAKEKSASPNITNSTLKFQNYSVPISIGQIGNEENGKTFVEVLGKFDINTRTGYKTFFEMFLAVMKVKISVGDKEFEFKSFSGINDGIGFNFSAEGTNHLKFDGIKFEFDTTELPDKITVYNNESKVVFNGKTKNTY